MHYAQHIFSCFTNNSWDSYDGTKAIYTFASPTRLLGYDLTSTNFYNVLSYFTDAARFATRTLNFGVNGNDIALLFHQIGVANGTVFASGTRAGLPLLYFIFYYATQAQYLAWINLGSDRVAQDLDLAVTRVVSYQTAVNANVTNAQLRIALADANLSAQFRAMVMPYLNTNAPLNASVNSFFSKWGAVPI
jgi:hypothetical protein